MEHLSNLIKTALSVGDLISIVGVLMTVLFYFASRLYICNLSRYYGVNKIYFNFNIDNKVKYYLIVISALLFATIYCIVSSFYDSNNKILLISIIPILFISLMIIIPYFNKLDIINYTYKRKDLKSTIKRKLISIIYVIANFILLFNLSVWVFLLCVENDVNRYEGNKFAINSETKTNKQSSEDFDKIFEGLGKKSYEFGKLRLKDRLAYFKNPEKLIRSDFMDLKEENLDGFFKFIKKEKYDIILFNLLKVLLLLRSYTLFNIFISICSACFILLIIFKILWYYINPKYKYNYLIIRFRDKILAILNEYENKFVCVDFSEDDNSKTIVLKTNSIAIYSPTEYRLEELLYKDVIID